MNNVLVDRERLKIDMQPVKLRIESLPYVIFIGRTFVPVINVYDIKKKRENYLIISPVSIASELYSWLSDDPKSIINIEFWINKISDDKFSKYEVTLA